MRRLGAIAFALLLVLAGCNAPGGSGSPTRQAVTPTATSTAGSTSTPTTVGDDEMTLDGTTPVTEAPSERPPVRVRSGSLPGDVDANETLARVENLTGQDVDHLDMQVVEPKPAGPVNPDGFFEAVGFAPTSERYLEVTGQYREGSVTVRVSEDASTAEAEAVVVHEFAHALQYSDESFTDYLRTRYVKTLDSRFAIRSTVEGSAVYVTDTYLERYADGQANQTEEMRRIVDQGPPFSGYLTGHYYFGAQYARSRVDSPRNLSTVYENPPTTSEQVLHGYTPEEEPMANLSASIHTHGEWFRWSGDGFYGKRTTAGEVLVRFMLQTELERSVANDAAAGWGNDMVFGFSDGTATGYVWALRWDTAGDADEFADAFRTYRERGGGNVSAWRFERVGDRTTVLVGGDEALLDAVSVTASGPDVNVTVGPSTSTDDRIRPPRPGSAGTPSRRR